jgi:hypothetical protein
VNASLVLDLNVGFEVLKEVLSGVDDLVLCLPRKISVEVKNVVILDPPNPVAAVTGDSRQLGTGSQR